MTSEHRFLSGEHCVIPLFRLGSNVFPGELLPLHIYEERYQRLLRFCLAEVPLFEEDETRESHQFGVLLTGKNSAQWGCSVEIQAVLNRYEDGKLDILTKGVRIFELMQELPEQDFPRAHVRWGEQGDEGPERLREVIREEFKAFLRNIEVEMQVPDVKEIRAFRIGALVRLDVFERQELLNADTEKARLIKLIDFVRFRNELVLRAGPEAVKSLFSV